MKKSLLIALILTWILTGCEKDEKPIVMEDNKSPDVMIQNENETLHQQIDQLQTQLQATEQKYKDLQKANEVSQVAQQQPLMTKYPNLADFTSEQDFQKIEIKDAKGSNSITDLFILRSVSNLFVIGEEASFGSGPQADIEPVQYILTTAKGSVKVSIVQLGIVSFDDLYPGQYFKVSDEAYQLAKAFMNKPSYIDSESTIVEMVNSGLIKVDDKYYVTLAGRIRLIALAFHNANKHESKKPNQLSPAILKMTFYHYGKEIQMNLYEGKVQIKDGAIEKWFDLKAEDIEQIRASFSAS